MYGYIYKFTNRLNGKIYIGKHKSDKIDEKYYGSGVVFLRAKEKYGIENFKFDILAICYSPQELNRLEKKFIKENGCFAKDGEGYNLAEGGEGGNTLIGKTGEEVEEFCKRYRGECHPMWGKHHKEETKQKMSENHADISGEKNPFYNKKHTDETKKLLEKNVKWHGKI